MNLTTLGIWSAAGVSGAPVGAGSYELIESSILTSDTSSVTFSSIPQDYKHLQIRFVVKLSSGSTGATTFNIELNSDSSSTYATHLLRGDGSTVTSSSSLSNPAVIITNLVARDGETSIFGSGIIDLLDYTNTSKFTTLRILSGVNTSTNKNVNLSSGLYQSTNAITAVRLFPAADAKTGSRFSLYGIKG